MIKAIFSTERLYFKEILPENANVLLHLHSLAEVVKYVGMPVWTDLQEAIDYSLTCAEHYQKYGHGRWGVFLKTTDEFIGLAGLLYRPEEDYIDLGYRFFPVYWGHGYATESVKGILEYAFSELKLDQITGFADFENLDSQRVMIKVGMRDVGSGICLGLAARKFEISQSDFFKLKST